MVWAIQMQYPFLEKAYTYIYIYMYIWRDRKNTEWNIFYYGYKY